MKKTPLYPLSFFVKSGGIATAFWSPCLPLLAVTVSKHYLPRCLRSTVTCGRGKTPNIVT